MKKTIVKIIERILLINTNIFWLFFPLGNFLIGMITLETLSEWDDNFYSELFYGIACIMMFILELALLLTCI